MSLLVVMGSGETAPTMVKVHRQVVAESSAAAGGGPAVMLDTPFGFQMNADDLVARTTAYFAESVGTPVEVVRWRNRDAPVVEQEASLALLGRASWAFAGPGSPTYALRQWRGTPVPEALLDVSRRGGTLVFGSAAACTLGTHTVPVYEIYKVGEEPRWEEGLDLLGRLTGIPAAVVPHYDNAEGGNHDTRFCYLGEQRLAALEAALPDEVGVLGVDEHTALLVDLATERLRVTGSGGVTVRRRGTSFVYPAGTEVPLDELRARLAGTPVSGGCSGDRGEVGVGRGAGPATGSAPTAAGAGEADGGPATSLRAEADALAGRFDRALQARDVDGCVTALLDLEAAIVAWSSDTDQNDDVDRARRALRSMVSRLGDLARSGARDPREVVGPLVELLLEVRARARAGRDYATSDLVRDRLGTAGIEVRDTPDGAVWEISPP